MEKDDEMSGSGNSYTTEFRMLDVRIGRWWSCDPYNQFSSPYMALGNKPINGIDPDGGWFWESKHIRNARRFAKLTGGSFHKERVKGRPNIGWISYGYTDYFKTYHTDDELTTITTLPTINNKRLKTFYVANFGFKKDNIEDQETMIFRAEVMDNGMITRGENSETRRHMADWMQRQIMEGADEKELKALAEAFGVVYGFSDDHDYYYELPRFNRRKELLFTSVKLYYWEENGEYKSADVSNQLYMYNSDDISSLKIEIETIPADQVDKIKSSPYNKPAESESDARGQIISRQIFLRQKEKSSGKDVYEIYDK